MHLKSLTLKGFKSFPDRTRLEFSPGISVVVGPNGSGKSNVTDAVLWALGEQSPLAVRGQSMQDVIFAGAHGVQAREQAEVELVICNADGTVDLPLSEISILRRLDRAGEGEYRLNGSRCRLVDVLELLSDTGLGKEMHSVVSQGRIEAIVTSKPRDRRILIEEAAGLGKHRKRRRRAQLKLDRTQDNLDRALDVEREARSRLRPLKRQAEAAALHERLERQANEARWALAAEAVRVAGVELLGSAEEVRSVRAERARVQARLDEVAARRAAAEQALAARGERRERIASAFYAARSAAERLEARLAAARAIAADAEARLPRRRERIASLEAALTGGDEPGGGPARVAALTDALARLEEDAAARLERELASLRGEQDAAEQAAAAARARAEAQAAALGEADAAVEAARAGRREAERAADAARRESARIGSDLAQLNQSLRRHAPAPGGARALAESLDAQPGCELALAAALEGRLTAALAASRGEAAALLDRAGADGGAVLVVGDAAVVAGAATRARPRAPRRCWAPSAPPTRRRVRQPPGCSPASGWSTISPRCPTISTASRSPARAASGAAASASCARQSRAATIGCWSCVTGGPIWSPRRRRRRRPSTAPRRHWSGRSRRSSRPRGRATRSTARRGPHRASCSWPRTRSAPPSGGSRSAGQRPSRARRRSSGRGSKRSWRQSSGWRSGSRASGCNRSSNSPVSGPDLPPTRR